MQILFTLIITTCLALILFPTAFNLILTRILSFSQASLKMKNPFSILHLHLELPSPMFSIKFLGIYVQEICLKIDVKRVKIRVMINDMRVVLMRDGNQFMGVRVVDGLMEDRIFANLRMIINGVTRRAPNRGASTRTNQGSRLGIAIKAIGHFIGLILLQLIQIQFHETDISIVACLPAATAQIPKQPPKSFTFLQNFSQYQLHIPQLTINANLHNDQQLSILFACPLLQLYTYQHMDQVLICCEGLQVDIRMPFTFSIRRSIDKLGVYVRVGAIRGGWQPGDFQDLAKFVNQLIFDPNLLVNPSSSSATSPSSQASSSSSEQQTPPKKFHLQISNTQLKLFSIAEAEYDTPQALKYLSNISYAVLKFNNIKINEDGVAIKQAMLSVKKYEKVEGNINGKRGGSTGSGEYGFEDEDDGDSGAMGNGFCREVVRINNLSINKQGPITRVSHDDVKFLCQKEELALLGKLFLLINQRVIVDQYDQDIYLPYVQTVQAYIDAKISLPQAFQQIITKKYQTHDHLSHSQSPSILISEPQSPSAISSNPVSSNPSSSSSSTVLYSPKQIDFQLDISQLIHKITLYNPEYRQSRSLYGEINHQLNFKRIVMEYKGIKQFQVADFKLFYKQMEGVNQLELQVGDINMVQNFATLKDYLVGFTIFKLLLQFSTGEEQDVGKKHNKTGKTGKKSLNFNKISLSYASQMLTLKKLSVMKQTTPDGRLSSLYFSLGKCDFSVQRLYQPKKFLKYPLPHSHNLLSITSITLKQYLTYPTQSPPSSSPIISAMIPQSTPQKSSLSPQFLSPTPSSPFPSPSPSANLLPPKQKYMINIKNPIFLLPQIDISDRLLNYVKTFNKLQPSIEIFMNNTTEQKLRAKRRKYKHFMIDTDVYTVKITDLLIGMEDSVFDRSMMNRMRFWREYLERKPKYNQIQFLNYLRQTSQKYNLFQITVQSISLDIKPLDSAGITEKSVKSWTSALKSRYRGPGSFRSSSLLQSPRPPSNVELTEQNRLIRVNTLSLSLQICEMKVKIRDYPFDVLSVERVKANCQYVKTKNLYEETLHYFIGEVAVGNIGVQIGLSLLSGLGEIERRLGKYGKSMDQYKNTEEFLHTIKTKSSVQLSSYKPFWHIMHKSTDWHITVSKPQSINIKLLTGLTPYSTQSLLLKLGPISLNSNPISTLLQIQSLQITTNPTSTSALPLKILQLGLQQTVLKTQYSQPDLSISLTISLQSQSPSSPNLLPNRLLISQKVTKQLWQIKQLRTDWLLIYSLVQPSSKRQQNVLKRQQQINYVQLLKIAMDNQLKNKQKQLSIFSILKSIKIQIKIDRIAVQIADENNEIEFIVSNWNNMAVMGAHGDKWRVEVGAIGVQCAVGRLKVYKGRVYAFYQSDWELLQAVMRVGEMGENGVGGFGRNDRDFFREVFIVARNVKMRFGQYAQVGKDIRLIQKKIEIQSLKIQLTRELKRMLDSLFLTIFETNRIKVENFTKSKYFKMSSVQKLRQTVVIVMRANRKKKNLCVKLKAFATIKSLQIGFKTSKRLLLLTNNKPSVLLMDTAYHSQDVYRVDPKMTLSLNFSQVQLWVSKNPNHLWIITKGYSPKFLTQSQRILKCSTIQFQLQKHENQLIPPYYQQIIKNKQIQRYTNLHVNVHQGGIQLAPGDIQILKEISQILIGIVNTREQKKKEMFVEKEKYQEMVSNGRQAIKTKLSWLYTDMIKIITPTLQSRIFFILDRINITLFNTKPKSQQLPSPSSSSQSQSQSQSIASTGPEQKYPILNLISSNIEIKILVNSDQNLKKQFKIHNLTIINCMEQEGSPFYKLFQMENHNNNQRQKEMQKQKQKEKDKQRGKQEEDKMKTQQNQKKLDDLAIIFQLQQQLLSATNPKVLWSYYPTCYLHIFPLKIRFTEQLYQQFYIFFFNTKPQTSQQKQKQKQQQLLSNILPDFYHKFVIDEFKVQAWYRTESRLKRMEGIHVGLERFQIEDVFLDRKGVFDRWVRFLVRQIAGQIFNVIGQKLFG